jgi:hypothetical protein
MAEFRILPTFTRPVLEKGGSTSTPWYRFLQSLHSGAPASAEGPITVGGSPFAYSAPTAGAVLVSGGTVTAIQITRSSVTLTGLTSGLFPLAQGDILTVTYSGLPTMTWYPR